MGVKLPYKRTCRRFTDNRYHTGSKDYITHPDYAEDPALYAKAFMLIQKDLVNLFDYVEPSDKNSNTYSFRILELLMRTCIEVEANFKAILRENGYSKREEKNWDMSDYRKINLTHRLSSYKIVIPSWNGEKRVREPFKNFENEPLRWYQAYNSVKHSRADKFREANLNNLMDAVCGLITILSAQFYNHDFESPYIVYLVAESSIEGINAIGEYFQVIYPDDWNEDKKYEFDWNKIPDSEKKFQKLVG